MQLRRIVSRYLWIPILTLFSVLSAEAQEAPDTNAEANRLFVHAVSLYRAAEAREDESNPSDYAEVKNIFDRLIDEFPGSRPAAAILAGGSPGGVDLARLAEMSARAGLKVSQRAVVQNLLEAYNNDVARIERVADNAHFALMSWAAYGDALAYDGTTRLGWKMSLDANPRLPDLKSVEAFLFFGPKDAVALAFRGTDEGSDWIINAGALSPAPLLNEQVTEAIAIARLVATEYPNVVFTGHSLGGRLAFAASLATGRPAIGFNSAPIGLNEFREFGLGAVQTAPITSFRSPEDILSGIFSRTDPVIANVPPTGVDPIRGLVTTTNYTHSIKVIARAMLDARTARDEGWLEAYLREQDGTGEVPTQPDGQRWSATMAPYLELEPGQSYDGINVGVNGDVTFRGRPVFPVPGERIDLVQVHAYRSPITQHILVIQRHIDHGGLRAALLFDGTSPRVVAPLLPENKVRGLAQAEDVVVFYDGISWSPDGRYAALQASRIKAEVSLLLVDVLSGEGTLVHPDEGGRLASVLIDELRYSDSGDTKILSAPFQKRECIGSNCEEIRLIDVAMITFDIAQAIQSNPWPTVNNAISNELAGQKWGPEIAAPEGFTLDQWLACEQQAQNECLRSAGFSEPALDFVEVFGERSAGGFARTFRELGQVDLVETDLLHAPWRSFFLVNGLPSEIFVTVPDPAFPGSYRDAVSKNLLRGVDPMGGDWGNVEVVSHRQIPGKGQRFVATSVVTSGCRACPIIGIALRQFDFDAKGKLVAETMLGMMDWRGRQLTQQYEGAEVLQDVTLAQFLLNTRGYDAGPMDGNFGARSRVALYTFQAEHCLPTTKIVDRATADALATSDFFSNTCEGDVLEASTATLDAVPVPTQSSGPSQSADCASIENDIARLECYDAASKGDTAESVKGQAAFGQPEVARLEALLTFGFFSATVDLGACKILVRDTRDLQTSGDFVSGGWSDWLGSTSNGVRTVGEQRDAVTFPLGSLDLRQTRPSESDGLSVVTESDALITRSRESEDFATGRIERESKTFRSYLLYTSSPYDALPVYELLSAADLACRQYGE